jgi:hypothetical protein
MEHEFTQYSMWLPNVGGHKKKLYFQKVVETPRYFIIFSQDPAVNDASGRLSGLAISTIQALIFKFSFDSMPNRNYYDYY